MSATGRMSLEAALRALLDHGCAGAAVLDHDGRHLFATRDYEEAHGAATGSMAGRRHADVLPQDAALCLDEAAGAARESGRAQFEYVLDGRGRISGDVLTLEAGDDEGVLYGVVLRTVDQDDLHEVKELRQRLHDAERRGRIGTWVWDPVVDLVWWSEELSRIYGRDEHHHGEPVPLEEGLAHQHPLDRQLMVEQLTRAVATGEPFSFEHRIITADHRLRWMSCRGSVELDAERRAVRVRGTDQDITERYVVRQQLARLARRNQMLLESVSEGILGLDRRGRITFANSAARQMLGRSQLDLRSVSLAGAVAMPGDATGPHAIEATLADGRERHVERALVDRPGAEPLSVDFTCTALRGNARIDGAVVALRDRSLRERYEDQIATTVEELRLVDAHRQLLLADLVAAQELERRRIAAEIHDDAVQAMSAVALRAEQLAGSLDAEAAGQLHRVRDVVRDATGRLRQLLVQLQPPELETAVGAAIEAYASAAALPFSVGVEDRLGEQPSMATRVVMYRIAQEALRNAAKHARAHHVDAVIEPAGDRVRLTIADDGVGIEPELLQTAQPGHLGIDTMRYRAELAGGLCTIASAPGAGTTVTVDLPRQEHAR